MRAAALLLCCPGPKAERATASDTPAAYLRQVAGWKSMYASTHGADRTAPKVVKKPLALPYLKPLVAPASVSRCNYLLGAEATTPYTV